MEEEGCGTDGGDGFSLLMEVLDECEDLLVFAKFHDGGATGEEKGVEGLVDDVGEEGVGDDFDAGFSGDLAGGCGGEDDFRTGAAEEIDGCDGFDFFEAVFEDTEDAFHVSIMNSKYPPPISNLIFLDRCLRSCQLAVKLLICKLNCQMLFWKAPE